MVNVSMKSNTLREARAICFIELPDNLYNALKANKEMKTKKGPIIATAIIAGVMAAKKTSELIPFCHPVPLDHCDITIEFEKSEKSLTSASSQRLLVECHVCTTYKTGVEMEALVGVTNAALCIYDMCKALSHDIIISDVKLMSKSGGKNDFIRGEKSDETKV
eukprot:CAMPEP_0182416900 /NCGR_PEP_ID=MMETSP1167-20130531/1299_1 /TAXON_ID=2988 /ORGANISM="Mallomonas Sp, Strain CCMP3275" /LENGTH=162 /DNA_ID=CAMNT_0024590069 /DNA_START=383 /DNA_END=871 /DNA_ORIENTATION=-